MSPHRVRLYQDAGELAGAVAAYIRSGLERGEAAVIIATPEHRAAFLAQGRFALGPKLVVLDAERALARFMAQGMPQWQPFHEAIGGLIARLRLRYPAVRAYGEMVDVLWQRGERDAAVRLEEYWNELGRLQTFTLLCAYRMDPLSAQTYSGALQCICRTHTELLPAPDAARFDRAVDEASCKVLDKPLAQILLSLAQSHRPAPRMPAGQAALLWLHQNMPRAAQKVLSAARAEFAKAG